MGACCPFMSLMITPFIVRAQASDNPAPRKAFSTAATCCFVPFSSCFEDHLLFAGQPVSIARTCMREKVKESGGDEPSCSGV